MATSNCKEKLTVKMIMSVILLLTHPQFMWAFRSSTAAISHITTSARRSLTRPSPSSAVTTKFYRKPAVRLCLVPDIQVSMQCQDSLLDNVETSTLTTESISHVSSILLTSDTESWRQYVPLIVSVAVIIDILLGSPLANLALGPMRRASERGSMGDSSRDSNVLGRNSLFSNTGDAKTSGTSKSKERVDSEAIAKSALDKARNTLELKQFLEENKTNEQRYDEIRRKIDKQMDELDQS